MRIGGRAVVRLGAAHDVHDTMLLAQHLLEMHEEALGAFLAVGDEADSLSFECVEPRRGLAGCRRLSSGRIEDAEGHGDSYAHFFGGSQSTQAPIGNVTAWLLLPSHGGMTAPKPPAGPPAAITSSWSGDSIAG